MRKNDSLRTERESLHVGVVSDMWLVVDQQKKDMGKGKHSLSYLRIRKIEADYGLR